MTLDSRPSAAATAEPLPGLRPPRRVAGSRRVLALVVGLAALVFAFALSVAVGSREIPLGSILPALFSDGSDLTSAAVQSRVPRTLLAVLAGIALSLSGALMQGLTRNPLAEPGILGITPGASLAVVTGIAFFGINSALQYIWFAIAGAAIASIVVYVIGSSGRGGPTPLRLALAGAATTAVFTSAIGLVMLPRVQELHSFQAWQIGGVGRASYDSMLQLSPFLLLGALLAATCGRGLNALAMGDEMAAALGQRVGWARGVAGLAAILLAGTATALCGPIAFLGLVVPHAGRVVMGADYRWILAFCAVWGGTLLVLADVLGRVVTRPSDIAVGVVTAVVGGPVFIAVVRRQRVREL